MLESIGLVCGILSITIGVILGASVAVDSIYGYYPEKYGTPAFFSWMVAFFCTILSAAGLWFVGMACLVVFVGLATHLYQIKGPHGWYDRNTEPPPRKIDKSLKDLE